MPSDKKRDYEVGYGKPPCHTRFKKGQSGNPKGRPSDTKNLSALLDQALDERVILAEDGKRKKISKRQAFINQLVDQAAKGDLRAGKILLDIYPGVESRPEAEAASSQTSIFSAADLKVIEQLKARLRGKKGESDE